jgi:hypothetical protein
LSRFEGQIAKDAPALQSKKLFGEIPSMGTNNGKPQRLNDQIDLIKEKAYQEGFNSGFKSGSEGRISKSNA